MKRSTLITIPSLLALAAAALFVLVRNQTDSQTARAPNVRLVTALGDFRLSDKRGEPLVLYFSFVG